MNNFIASILLRKTSRARKISISHLDDRLLNDIGLCRLDFHTGRSFKKSA
jgi:uncharacterized protein YjiS (DUF1127 family)